MCGSLSLKCQCLRTLSIYFYNMKTLLSKINLVKDWFRSLVYKSRINLLLKSNMDFPGGSVSKEVTCSAGDPS